MENFNKLFTPFDTIEFSDKQFDFSINPNHFIKWLEIEENITEGDYKERVSGMCEYGCLYISMLLNERKLKGKAFVCEGKFGFWEHFWIAYEINNKEYIIDLTLRQFIDSPKLAISEKKDSEMGYNHEFSEKTPIQEYIKEKRAFEFYANPNNLKRPQLPTSTSFWGFNEI